MVVVVVSGGGVGIAMQIVIMIIIIGMQEHCNMPTIVKYLRIHVRSCK
jgi:hypothetical protein